MTGNPKFGKRWAIERNDGSYCACFVVRNGPVAMIRINAMTPDGLVASYLLSCRYEDAEAFAVSFREIIGHDGKNPCDWYNFVNWN